MQVLPRFSSASEMDPAEFFCPPELLRSVESRTHRQVRELRIVYDGSQVVLSGLSRTYYVKQLATHAVLDLLPHAEVENAIAVSRV